MTGPAVGPAAGDGGQEPSAGPSGPARSAAGRLFVLLGDPVGHSVSPAIHRAAFRALGVEAEYRAVRVAAGEVAATMRAHAGRGGGNVTLPHKGRAAAALDRASPDVSATGACNCFWADPDGALAGDNTDVGGFRAAAAGLLGHEALRGARVLLLGAGGGARAVAVACVREGARVEVLNRTVSRARALAADAGEGVRALEAAAEARGPYDLAVNATSLGLRAADPSPPGLEGREVGAALDLVYGASETPWVRHARALGIPAADGLGMLVAQAARSLERWLPGAEAPREAMRRAAAAALGRAADGGPGPGG